MMATGCKPKDGGEGTTGSTSTGTSGSSASANGEIAIGLVAAQNGDLRPWGIDSSAGVELAVNEFNEAGGLDGKKVTLKIQDSNSKPEEGKSAAEKLVSEGVLCVLGEVASGITLQMREVTVPKGIPLVTVGSTRDDVTKDSKGLVSRVCYTDSFQGPVMALFAYRNLGLRRMAIMTDNKQPYSQGLSKSFAEKFKALGGQIVTEQFYESGQNQFQGQLTQIKRANPDGIFMSGYFTEVGPMARQIRDLGMRTQKLLGGDGWDSSQLQVSGGDAIVGGYFCNHYNNEEERPEVVNFLDKWKKAYKGEIPGTTMGALGYDAAGLVLDALKRVHASGQEINAANLAKAIYETEDFKGVSGSITLKGRNGDPLKRALVVEVTRTGQKFFAAIEPNDPQL